jgi:phosphate transport system permease protein
MIEASRKQGPQFTMTKRWASIWRHGDPLYWAITFIASLLVIALVVAIGVELWQNSALSRQAFGLRFLTTAEWDPTINQTFGALPFILGTLVTSFVALIIAVPIGLGAAIFLAELAPGWLKRPLGFLIELLAAVPSVVYGLWGLFAFIPTMVRPVSQGLSGSLGFLPIFQGPVYGLSRLAAALILTIMILPTITAISREVLTAIPSSQREASLALGATRWETISRVLVPYGFSGIIGAVILGLGRALGETMAVTMVIGNNLDLSASLLHPGYTLASIIANEFTEATYDLYLNALIEIGLILFVLTLLVNVLARLLIRRVTTQRNGEANTSPSSAKSVPEIEENSTLSTGVSNQLHTAGAHPSKSLARIRVRKGVNIFMLAATGLSALIIVVPLIWILVFVMMKGAPSLSIGFFTQLPTPAGVPGGGLVNALVGSGITVGIGLLIAAPVGILAALFMISNPRSPWVVGLHFMTDVISGVPSIVMGIFAYTLIVLPQRHFSALSGGIVLAFIMVPTIIRTTEEMLKLVPVSLREGSLALGAPEWRTYFSVMLPAAISGVVTGLLLAVARAAGEAAPMLFTAFGNPFMSAALDQPIATLPHTIFVYAISPYPDWQAKAWGTALVLIALVLTLNIIARLVVWLRVRRVGTALQ